MAGYAERKRRFFTALTVLLVIAGTMFANGDMWQQGSTTDQSDINIATSPALEKLDELEIKGRAPKTNYDRSYFGGGWTERDGCDTRNIVLNRDLTDVVVGDECKIHSGTLLDPYTGKTIQFKRGVGTSDDVQIDHVVALSDAWQKGAQRLSQEQRIAFANDPMELLAVDGSANQQKSGSDAASWLPSNKAFRCQYIARQLAVKLKYDLWATQSEYDAMKNVLLRCPGQRLPMNG